MASAEKRKFPRLALLLQDGCFGHFILPDQSILVASIINLSAGGLNMAIKADEAEKLKERDTLVLQQIVGAANLAFLSDINALDISKIHKRCRLTDLGRPIKSPFAWRCRNGKEEETREKVKARQEEKIVKRSTLTSKGPSYSSVRRPLYFYDAQ